MTKKRLFFLALILFVVLHFLYPSPQKSGDTPATDRFFVSLFKPVTWAFRSVGRTVTGVFDRYFFLVNAKKENESLKDQIDALYFTNQKLRSRLAKLKQTVQVQDQFKNLIKERSVLPASIAFFDPMAVSKTLTLNVGRKHGVKLYDVVVTTRGLAGKVVRVYDSSSQILLVSDPAFSVDVQNDRTKKRALVTGVSLNRMGMQNLPYLSQVEFFEKGADHKKGDVLETSGLGGVFPPQIPVGEVVELDFNSELKQKIVIRPRVDLTKLDELFVLVQTGAR